MHSNFNGIGDLNEETVRSLANVASKVIHSTGETIKSLEILHGMLERINGTAKEAVNILKRHGKNLKLANDSPAQRLVINPSNSLRDSNILH